MEITRFTLTNPFTQSRKGYVIEQGIPVEAIDRELVSRLGVQDQEGHAFNCHIEHDGRDESDRTVWVRLTMPVDIEGDESRSFTLVLHEQPIEKANGVCVQGSGDVWQISTPNYRVSTGTNGYLKVEDDRAVVIDGLVDFLLWPDARSIIGGGGGTNRLASFIAEGWTVEEQTGNRCLLVLKGKVPKFAAYTSDPADFDPEQQFDCELELAINAFTDVIRTRWRIDNYTTHQAYLERYCLSLPLSEGCQPKGGEPASDGKFLRWAEFSSGSKRTAITAHFIDALGEGAGIHFEKNQSLGEYSVEQLLEFAAGQEFKPHLFLASDGTDGSRLRVISGGVNPPHDACQWADNPEVHRLFYRGMGRTFEGAIILNAHPDKVQSELNPIYFELPPNYYSKTGALPEQGDHVDFGEFKEKIFSAAEWLLREQWKGTLWWGEWWREWDEMRKMGVESTANGNNPLGPLYHYFRTGDSRFVECGKRAMEFVCDVQLSKRRGGLGPFFHSRRYLMDQMEWVHMRYQRIDGPMKMAHFLGDRRLRTKIIDAMRIYANNLVYPDGTPGFGDGGPYGKRVPAGADCTNFGEVLCICYRETGEQHFLDKAKSMANWTLRHMKKWNWDEYVGNSYGWHFLMRGMLQTVKLTGNKRFKDWYVDMADKNLTYPLEQIDYRNWMSWLLVEAEKMSGNTWYLEEMQARCREVLNRVQPDGAMMDVCKYPWSKFPSRWMRIYDQKTLVAYVPVLAARMKALNQAD